MSLTVFNRTGPSGYSPFPSFFVSDDRTGQAPLAMEMLSLEGTMALGRFEVAPGEQRDTQVLVFSALLATLAMPMSITWYWNSVVINAPLNTSVFGLRQYLHFFVEPSGEMTIPVERSRGLPAPPAGPSPAPVVTPAEELRSISGLPPAILARIFGVSRTTFYNWMEGATPRDARFQHLVDVLAHIKEAQRRLPSTIDVAAWLRTPISPGGRSPLDLLEQKRFSTFRGLLVRARSTDRALSTPQPLPFPTIALSREESHLARERISRTPRLDDRDDAPPEPDDGQ